MEKNCPSCKCDWKLAPPTRKPGSDYYDCQQCKSTFLRPQPKTILTLQIPVPVPEIIRFSRWQVFLALFSRRSHFTTCTTLRYNLAKEAQQVGELQAQMVRRHINREMPDHDRELSGDGLAQFSWKNQPR